MICSAEQLSRWRASRGLPSSPVATLGIRQVAPGIPIEGPVPGLDAEVFALHARRHGVEG